MKRQALQRAAEQDGRRLEDMELSSWSSVTPTSQGLVRTSHSWTLNYAHLRFYPLKDVHLG